MKIVFMGTPDIAKGCLQKLIDEKLDVVGVVLKQISLLVEVKRWVCHQLKSWH